MYYCHGIYDLLAMQVATCSGRAIRSKKKQFWVYA